MIIPSELCVESRCDLISIAEDVAQLEANSRLQACKHDQETPLAFQISHILTTWLIVSYLAVAAYVSHRGCVYFHNILATV